VASLLGGSYPLHDGNRVRLRLARGSDARALVELVRRASDAPPDELAIRRLVQFDPRSRFVLCATALIEGRETLVGVGSIVGGSKAPDPLFADERLAPGVGTLLEDALVERAA
jgi:hypothetical protein